MALLKRLESNKVDFRLIDYLKYPQKLATVFGYGKISQSRNLFLKTLYFLYSFFAVAILVFMLIRLLMEVDWESKFDLPKAAITLSIIWSVQSLLSALFFIYVTRKGSIRHLKRRWLECGADELIAQSNFRLVKWRWLAPVIVFCCLVLASEIAEVLLEYYGLTLESLLSKTPFVRFWQLCVLLPATVFCSVAWSVSIYTFYLVCVSLSYAWLGFGAKIKNLGDKSKSIGFGDESVRFVADTHFELTKLTETVSGVYGPYAFVMILLAVPELFLQLYFTTTMPADGFLKGQCLTWLIISFVSVFVLFSACVVNTSASQVAEVFYLHYQTEWTKMTESDDVAISQKSLLETSILLTKLYNTSVNITASGWFDVSKMTLGAVMSILITGYYIFFLGGPAPEDPCALTNITTNILQNVTVV